MITDDVPMAPSVTASLLAGVLGLAMDAIITADQRHEIVLFNHAAEKMFGWLRQEVMQQPLEKLTPQRFRFMHGDFLGQFGATGSTASSMGSAAVMIHGLRANGQEFPVEVSILQAETPEGRLFTAIVRDIADRQAAQAQLPLTQRCELDRMGAALRAWQPVRAELINYTRSGQDFWMELDITPVADTKGRFTRWVSVQRDITGRKQAEQALAKAQVKVREHLFTLQRAAEAAQAITAHQTLEGMAQELAEQARGVIGAHQASVSLAADGDWAQAINALSLSTDHARYRSPAGRVRMMRGWLAVRAPDRPRWTAHWRAPVVLPVRRRFHPAG